MGLFSGSFGTGLVTGLATSVDGALKTAMAKREEEMTAVKKFQMTRQAQKIDAAEAEDKRAEKALDRFIREFKGDVAKGLAAYNAAGGSADTAEQYLKDVDDTRRKTGAEYSLQDKFNFEGIDLSQFADLDTESARAAIRTEVKPVDVQMEDTGLLSKIGLGKDDMGAEVSADINELMPARERVDIEGLFGAALDRSGLVESEIYQRQAAKDILTGKEKYTYNIGRLAEPDLTPDQREAIMSENALILAGVKELGAAERSASAGGSISEYTQMYKNGLAAPVESSIQYTAPTPNSEATAVNQETGEQLVGAEANAYRQQKIQSGFAQWIASTLLDEKGQPINADAAMWIKGYRQQDTLEQIQAAIAEQGGTEAEDKPVVPSFTKDDVAGDPEKYVTEVRNANPNVSTVQLETALIAAGVPRETINSLLFPEE